MTGPAAGSRPRAGVAILLGLRFLLELALFASFLLATASLVGGVAGWLAGAAAALLVALLWGLLLSPRRRVATPVAVRVVVELALFAGAAGLLVAVGSLVAAGLLLGLELVVLALLGGPDRHAI